MIPPRNIYYMLLYAWGHFIPGEIQTVGSDESPNLPTLLAGILNARIHRLLRRGIDQGYVSSIEDLRAPRGRLKMTEMVGRQTLLRGYAVCEIDELTPDILHNRILLETILRLAGEKGINRGLQRELKLTAARMRGVSRIRLTGDVFKRVQLSRNTAQYGLLMHICELLFHEHMPDSQGEGGSLVGLAQDEVRMAYLYEEFLRSFYKIELPHSKVAKEQMRWEAKSDAEALALLPIMETDVTIRSPGRVLVIDAKYYPSHLTTSRFGTERVHSSHLYQLKSYLNHVSRREPEVTVDGMLIYPQGPFAADLRYCLEGHNIRIATVNMGQEWQDIHNRLLQLVDFPADDN